MSFLLLYFFPDASIIPVAYQQYLPVLDTEFGIPSTSKKDS
jgi:hypothetical protein